jgi:hypothetical protein
MSEHVVWWNKSGEGGPWLVRFPDGTIGRCEWVTFGECRTDINHEGFRDLPGGPRGVLRGEVVGFELAEEKA